MLDFDALQQLTEELQPLFIGKSLNFTLGKLKAHGDQVLNRFNVMTDGFSLDNILPLLAKLNRTAELDEFLSLLGVQSAQQKQVKTPTKSKILLLGRSQIADNEINKIFQEYGIDTNRVIIQREYNELKKQGFTANSDKYDLILLGPIPHKTATTGDAVGTIGKIKELYGDKVIVLQNNGTPKITRHTIEDALNNAILQNLIQSNTH